MLERSVWDDEGKVILLRQAIQRLAETKGPDFACQIEIIIFEHHSKKRFDDFLRQREGNTPQDFVNHVVEHFERMYVEVNSLLVEHSEEAWQARYLWLQKITYDYLHRKGFSPGRDTQDYAQECAQESALQILNSHFPYTSSFEAWAVTLMQNVCRKRITKDKNPGGFPKENILPYADEVSDNLSELISSQIEDKDLYQRLQAALEQLTPTEQQLIQRHFLEEPKWTFKQISMHTNKSMSAVYRQLQETLDKLRKLLDT